MRGGQGDNQRQPLSGAFAAARRRWVEDPQGFWAEAAAAIEWAAPWEQTLDESDAPFYRWFAGGRLNICWNALDRHVRMGRGDAPALIYDSAMTQTRSTLSYRELLDRVARAAGALRDQGVSSGDRILIYMPMIPEAVVAMLACARIGCVHSVVFGGFAAAELAARIDDARPAVIVTASCGLEPGRMIEYKPLVDRAIDQAGYKPGRCLVVQRSQLRAELVAGRDLDWDDAVASASPADCVSVAATDPLYILYTSGTSGRPKGIVRDHGGYAVALAWSMTNVYGAAPGEVFWAASDVGWVVGHSYIVYGPLLHACATVLYEGKPVGTPDAGSFWRVIAEHGVQTLFTAPTALRAIRQRDPEAALIERYDLSSLRTLFLAGEHSDPETLRWAEDRLRVPVVDHWWQTETGWPIAATCQGIKPSPTVHGSVGRVVPGWDLRVLGPSGEELRPAENGALAVRLPLPPGSARTLWNADARFIETYLTSFPGFYATADGGYIDEEGYVFVTGRTDDVINVAGHRLSTGAIEDIVASHPDVAECAVVGASDELKGQTPIAFVVTKTGAGTAPETLGDELVLLVRERLGPVAAFKIVITVERLPKTRSGKILRATMRRIVDGLDYTPPASIEDPQVLVELKAAADQARHSGRPVKRVTNR